MSFIKTVSEDSATGLAAELQGRDRAALGYVPNYAKLFTLRPEVYEAWAKLNGAVKKSMDRRRYELGTVAAACGRGIVQASGHERPPFRTIGQLIFSPLLSSIPQSRSGVVHQSTPR